MKTFYSLVASISSLACLIIPTIGYIVANKAHNGGLFGASIICTIPFIVIYIIATDLELKN